MATTIRTFIAIPVRVPGFLGNICRQLQQMGHPIKAVPVANLHLTLRFLGPTELDLIRPVSDAIHAITRDGFALDLVGLGVFPHLHRPRVVWVGVRGAEPAAAMVDALESPLDVLGWPSDGRVWRAHITLARVNGKAPVSLLKLLEQHHETHFGDVAADSVVLMQSQQGTCRGPKYVPLETVVLG